MKIIFLACSFLLDPSLCAAHSGTFLKLVGIYFPFLIPLFSGIAALIGGYLAKIFRKGRKK